MIDQKKGRNSDEYKIQDNQYVFPYHYIPHFDKDNCGVRLRMINNGLEYLCYTKHIISLINESDYNTILEVGCGDGRILNFLGDKTSVTGVDLSEKGIVFARAFNPELKFLIGDAGDIKEKFSIVLAIEVLEHIPDNILPKFWQTIYDRCETGGKIIISVPSVNKAMIKKHFRHYDQKTLELELEKAGLTQKLEIEKLEFIYKETKLLRIWKRFTSNKFWIFEPHSLRKKVWNYIWQKLRFAESNTGYHLVAVLRKK